jgi:hypothetical protein
MFFLGLCVGFKIMDYVYLSVYIIFLFHCADCIFLTCGKHLHDRIKSLRGKSWAHNFSLEHVNQARKVICHVANSVITNCHI